MLVRKVARVTVLVLGLLSPLVAVAGPASAAPVADDVQVLARTLYYDTSQAQEFAADWDTAAANWNKSVTNVRLVKRTTGSTVNIRILADNGWPRAYVTSLGNGTVYMGRQAVQQGYYRPRISTHEIGHILGLPDRRTGLCADLMSGSSAPIACKNDLPNAAERAEVDRRFAGSAALSDVRTAGYSASAVECFVY
ncbi:snapalysin family zinc-dependent metalloprotease [Saccharothrix longispora]|uniref:snapalysin family zinc-dependent metalloprotease n=1 Tax=Saccharothrix longispora TaxID=33920 RepID=UPI0028FDC0FC|nr:snapalysin family zinc-dependent metalloprotease [Saccharothrix longispora]MDU0294106.1 snapalysin family zinc-dependent metalloprotease [Saccharothrix longispora]